MQFPDDNLMSYSQIMIKYWNTWRKKKTVIVSAIDFHIRFSVFSGDRFPELIERSESDVRPIFVGDRRKVTQPTNRRSVRRRNTEERRGLEVVQRRHFSAE